MSSENIKTESMEKGDGRKKLLVVAVVIVFVALIGAVSVLAYMVLRGTKQTEVAADKVQNKAVVSAEAAEEVMEEMLKAPDANIPQTFTATQNAVWTFPSGSDATNDAYVANDSSNETAIYFDLIVDETGEVIYSSPILELGAELDTFKLDKPLDAGTYDCTVEYHLVDDDRNTLTTSDFGVTVKVLE